MTHDELEPTPRSLLVNFSLHLILVDVLFYLAEHVLHADVHERLAFFGAFV